MDVKVKDQFQPQRAHGRERAQVRLNGPQQGCHVLGVGDGSVMLFFGRGRAPRRSPDMSRSAWPDATA